MGSSSQQSWGDENRGFPSKCVCSLAVETWTSKTQDNPGRPFYRCISQRDVSLRSNKRDGHFFKWVEEAVLEEVEDCLPKIGRIEIETTNAKSEVEELKSLIEGLMEDLSCSKREIRKWKVMNTLCFVCIFFITCVIVYMMLSKANETKFDLGY